MISALKGSTELTDVFVSAHVCRRAFSIPGITQLCIGISLLYSVLKYIYLFLHENMKYNISWRRTTTCPIPKSSGKTLFFFLVVFWHSKHYLFPLTQLLEKHLHSLFSPFLQHLTHLCEFHLTNEWKQCANFLRRGFGLCFEEKRKRQRISQGQHDTHNTNPLTWDIDQLTHSHMTPVTPVPNTQPCVTGYNWQ